MSVIPRAIQRQVAAQSANRCGYCQSQQRLMGVALTIDHIIPQSVESRRFWGQAGWHPPS